MLHIYYCEKKNSGMCIMKWIFQFQNTMDKCVKIFSLSSSFFRDKTTFNIMRVLWLKGRRYDAAIIVDIYNLEEQQK